MDNPNVITNLSETKLSERLIEDILSLPCKADGRVYIPGIDRLALDCGKNNSLAMTLWRTGIVNARELAIRIIDSNTVEEELLEEWVTGLADWELTDAFTGKIVRRTRFAEDKARQWVMREPEFERRAGFATIAQMAWSKNNFTDELFIDFLSLVEQYSFDNRFYVKKAVNWALRDIGKRNKNLREHAAILALNLQKSENKTSRWVGTHRAREII